ncbi:hypothetical protein MRX96_036422 [Rhipicephalus microplus]
MYVNGADGGPDTTRSLVRLIRDPRHYTLIGPSASRRVPGSRSTKAESVIKLAETKECARPWECLACVISRRILAFPVRPQRRPTSRRKPPCGSIWMAGAVCNQGYHAIHPEDISRVW